ncbi:hypothetical protein E3J38_00010 [candidate division TA06 bacterium]|uniref:S-adenosyl-l-methionine hydroxide adenosyltransferase N-terminal domain-containing protein n=1 Tax=candidate division TA06 bacterium TaxID=2250710 RepID=A0A523XWJ5_UNCT6|nr:MAG: hypothetical protein E3J38_00010 [candidate division TA06 bacterium]
MVEFDHDLFQLIIYDRSEFSILGRLADQSIHVFISATRPGSIRIAPHIKIVDLSHNISPQNVHKAILILHRSFPDFSQGTIPAVVVDPAQEQIDDPSQHFR